MPEDLKEKIEKKSKVLMPKDRKQQRKEKSGQGEKSWRRDQKVDAIRGNEEFRSFNRCSHRRQDREELKKWTQEKC